MLIRLSFQVKLTPMGDGLRPAGGDRITHDKILVHHCITIKLSYIQNQFFEFCVKNLQPR
ncbi:hypothetical protein [Nostoc sp. MG11]|uniref:hypothetical protein n=1 Tax=Nostoc sp. MG11 TaxID=2721166 RepID=UPI00186712F0|nr:hypothetical protein [Nostoc sp. MG11]